MGVSAPEVNISPPPCTVCMTNRLGESPTFESSLTVRRIGDLGVHRRHRGLKGNDNQLEFVILSI